MQFNEIICGDAAMPVKMLVQKLKSDLEVRYHFELSGALKYPSSNAITGHGNRYVTVHQYSFVAALLDPRMRSNLKTIMTASQYQQLQNDVVDPGQKHGGISKWQ